MQHGAYLVGVAGCSGSDSSEVRYQWDNHVLPACRNFLLPYRHHCDLHVVNEAGFQRAREVLRHHLLQVSAGVPEPRVQPV